MPRIELVCHVDTPPETVFDVARDIEVHAASMRRYRERARSASGARYLQAGDEVSCEARHLGKRRRLTARISQLDAPRRFRDSMVRGPFRRFDHDDFFEPAGAGTIMRDVFDYDVPGGRLGRVADRVLVHPRLTRLLAELQAGIKAAAERAAARAPHA